MDWSQNMARGIVFFKKLIFGVIFLEGYTLPPPSRIFYNYRIFNILQSFYHLSFLPDSRGKTRTTVSPSVRRLAPYRHYTRKIRTRITPVSRGRVPWCGPVAVGRDAWPPPPVGVPTLPARAVAPRRGARLDNPRPRRASPSCGSRPTAHYPRVMHTPLHPRITWAAR